MAKKNALDEKLLRIIYIFIAIGLGGAILLGLSYTSEITTKPLNKLFDYVADATRSAENKVIIQNRKNDRINKLAWVKSKDIEYFRNPQSILIGAHDNQSTHSFESIVSLEDSLRTNFSLIQIYAAWGSKEEQAFPQLQVQAIVNMGSIPVITWEPWLSDFDSNEFTTMRNKEVRSTNGLDDIANGMFDSYIITWANACKKVDSPIFVRWGHEMNDPYRYPWGPQNNKPESYVNAWRHIHEVFEKEGVTNVLWVWNPSLSYKQINTYYPGNEYVDYTGVDVLNFGTVATWSDWYSFKQIFGTQYELLAEFNKPIMLAELGSLAIGGDRQQWFKDALVNLPEKYPLIKSVLFFHVSDDKTTTMQSLSWYFKYDTVCTKIISEEINKWNK